MQRTIKNIIKPLVPRFIFNLRKEKQQKQHQEKQIEDWKKKGSLRPVPHIVKQLTISEFKNKYSCNVFVETGTYLGDMVEAQRKRFKKVFSIELGIDLFKNAKKRFEPYKNVTLFQGDSGKVLPEVMKYINEPAVFWLDGHYSEGITAKGDKDCPIYEELNGIFAAKKWNHILLIDDAFYFNGTGDYPTQEALTNYIKAFNPNYKFELKNDILCYFI